MPKAKAPIIILEGTWFKNHEVPLILPYFQALATSHETVSLSHRTIRNVEDIGYYVSKIPKNSGAFLYFACHGSELALCPTEENEIEPQEFMDALKTAKEGAIDFVHFGCCEMIDAKERRAIHESIMGASGARWSSGYTESVEWLSSTLLDLALVNDVFVPQYAQKDGRVAQLKKRALNFISDYEQLARRLGFSALSQFSNGDQLFPARLR